MIQALAKNTQDCLNGFKISFS